MTLLGVTPGVGLAMVLARIGVGQAAPAATDGAAALPLREESAPS
ncbi:MAG: hypothetical protein ACREN1_08840 [Candidatus Dormibacteria bacterium]